MSFQNTLAEDLKSLDILLCEGDTSHVFLLDSKQTFFVGDLPQPVSWFSHKEFKISGHLPFELDIQKERDRHGVFIIFDEGRVESYLATYRTQQATDALLLWEAAAHVVMEKAQERVRTFRQDFPLANVIIKPDDMASLAENAVGRSLPLLQNAIVQMCRSLYDSHSSITTQQGCLTKAQTILPDSPDLWEECRRFFSVQGVERKLISSVACNVRRVEGEMASANFLLACADLLRHRSAAHT